MLAKQPTSGELRCPLGDFTACKKYQRLFAESKAKTLNAISATKLQNFSWPVKVFPPCLM
jgi:hypothetical protein